MCIVQLFRYGCVFIIKSAAPTLLAPLTGVSTDRQRWSNKAIKRRLKTADRRRVFLVAATVG